MRKFTKFLIAGLVLVLTQVAIQAQTTGSISGTILDPNKSVVAGATVVVKNNATEQEFTVTTNDDGYFKVAILPTGTYTATITAQGFKKAVAQVKVDVGTPTAINVEMAVGAPTEEVTVVGTGELLRTENATVGTTLTGRQITDIPTASRDALDLVLAMPGTTTPGRPRTSTINGLPKGALNITLDGVNVQDNILKSSDGFFTYVRPRTDAIAEVTTSTSNPGAESSGEGAVQIKFVTQGGGSDYRGGAYWYHRDPWPNANYWFNNRDLVPLPGYTTAPHTVMILNQFGGKVGGPIWKDKAFFFVNYEEFRLPERSPTRTVTVMSPEAQSGIYRFTATAAYVPPAGSGITCAVSGTGQLCSFNVLTKATSLANPAMPGTTDATVTGLLGSMRGSLAGLQFVNTGDPNLQQVSFQNPGGQVRKFPTVRFDFQPWKDHHIENIWNYQVFDSQVDFLNGADPNFPGFPNFGSQDSIRFSNVTAWRWNIMDNLVNEARFGLVGGSLLFFPEVNAGQFANQGGNSLGLGFGITTPTTQLSFERRNAPVNAFNDSLNWIHGNHSFSFGGNYNVNSLWRIAGNAVPTVNFGISSTLEAANFSSLVGQLPTANQGGAAQLYATLTGRISSVGASAYLNEDTNVLTYNGTLYQRSKMVDYGFFAQDTWKIRPNLTLTLGMRWELQGPFTPENGTFSFATYEALWGESGVGNIFKPGTLTGAPTVYNPLSSGTDAWEADNNNIAPSLGVAWQPNFRPAFLRRVFGEPGQTVVRGGYSRAYVREGFNSFLSIIGSNPGPFLDVTRNITGSPYSLPTGLLLRNGTPPPPAFPATFTFPYVGTALDSVNVFDPNLQTGYVDSYTVGIQRELTSNMAIEFRYVNNRGKDLWRQINLNEINVIENGFLAEFRLAQQNLASNVAGGFGANFRYRGPATGTNPLPILMAYITGLAPTAANASNTANYANALFANATLVSPLNPLAPSPTGLAGILGGTANASLFEPTRISAGIPINFFFVNPGKRGGGAWTIGNSGKSYYDAFQFEFRRRLSKGLLVQANYVFGKSLSNTFASSSVVADQPATLREGLDMRYGVTPFDITQALKTNFIWELPIGRGQPFLSDVSGWVNHLVGGWGINGNIRIQSGTPLSLGGVQLVGMTAKELQDSIGIYRDDKDAAGTNSRDVFFLPFDIRQNTYRANNISLVAGVPTYTQGAPTGRYIAPANAGNCAQPYSGACGFQNLVLKGPAFFRSDISFVKKFRFTERFNMELRGELLNAFNNINWIAGAAANDVNAIGGFGATTFARFTAAYQDTSTTNDPGGRLVQWVVRLNF
jgi:hypothetical protein